MTQLPFKNYPKLDKTISIKLTKYHYDRLARYCKKHKLHMSYLIREMINYWLDKEYDI